jgi:copper(I)-binding protein
LNLLRLGAAFSHARTENMMCNIPKLAFAALLICFAAPALAQGTGSGSIMVEQPWSRATHSGANTGAVYMTINNRSGTADRLTGASSDVANKVKIHEMKVENGVMRMREITGGLSIPANGSVVLKPPKVYNVPARSKGGRPLHDGWGKTIVLEPVDERRSGDAGSAHKYGVLLHRVARHDD